MWQFNFICRGSKADRNGLSPIELSIIINSKRTYVALPMKVSATDFKKKMSSKRNNEVLEYTSTVRIQLNKYINEMMAKEMPITASTLKDYFVNGGTTTYTLQTLYNEYIKHYKSKELAGEVTACAVRKYELALQKFIEFVGDMEINSITPVHIEGFKYELLKEFARTTASHTLVKVKSAFIYAVNKGIIRINPFAQLKIDRSAEEVVKLDDIEVEMIKRKQLIGRLDKVRDLFLFQCYTGLSYADIATLLPCDIQTDGTLHFIRKARCKTKITYFAVVDDDALAILNKYDYQLPVMSNQKYNSYLKEIGDLCNIGKSLHSHLARHTCATRLLNNGIPMEIVAKVLGHSNTRMTAHYAKLLDNTVLDAFKKQQKLVL